MVHNVLDELDSLGCAELDEWVLFDPFGELVNCHINVLETTLSFLKRSYLIQPLAGERPSGRDADEIVSLSCEHLTTFAFSDKFFCVFQRCWPVESGAESFAD